MKIIQTYTPVALMLMAALVIFIQISKLNGNLIIEQKKNEIQKNKIEELEKELSFYRNWYQEMVWGLVQKGELKINDPKLILPQQEIKEIPEPSQKTSVDPSELIKVIKNKQKKHVKESSGKWAYECFTDDNLKSFKSSNVIKSIVDDLKVDRNFLSIAIATKKMSSQEWQKLRNQAISTFKPTWAELGRISPEAQTDSGQTAEKMIAQAIVDLITNIREKPVQSIMP